MIVIRIMVVIVIVTMIVIRIMIMILTLIMIMILMGILVMIVIVIVIMIVVMIGSCINSLIIIIIIMKIIIGIINIMDKSCVVWLEYPPSCIHVVSQKLRSIIFEDLMAVSELQAYRVGLVFLLLRCIRGSNGIAADCRGDCFSRISPG